MDVARRDVRLDVLGVRFKMSDLSTKDNNIISNLKVCQRLKYLIIK
jgi:hypothetical protein